MYCIRLGDAADSSFGVLIDDLRSLSTSQLTLLTNVNITNNMPKLATSKPVTVLPISFPEEPQLAAGGRRTGYRPVPSTEQPRLTTYRIDIP